MALSPISDTYYALHEPGAWPNWGDVCSFGGLAAAFYLLHLLIAFVRELRATGKHDYYSGTPHLMRPAFLLPTGAKAKAATIIKLWLEPGLVLVAAVMLHGRLSSWLLLVAAALWLKEAINYWYRIRQQKKQADIFDDASESIQTSSSDSSASQIGAGGRKLRERRPRAL